MTIEDTSMQIFKWVPVRIEDQLKQMLESQTSDQNQSINNNEISELQNSLSNDRSESKQNLDETTCTKSDTNMKLTKANETLPNGNEVNNDTERSSTVDKSFISTADSEPKCTPIVAEPISSGVVSNEPGNKDETGESVFEELSKLERAPVVAAPQKEKETSKSPTNAQAEMPTKSEPDIGGKRKLDDDDEPSAEEPPAKQTKVTDSSEIEEQKSSEMPTPSQSKSDSEHTEHGVEGESKPIEEPVEDKSSV